MFNRVVKTSAAVFATAVAGSVLTALPASAQAYEGKAIANGGLTVRALPTTASTAKGSIAEGKAFPIECKVRGTSVDGNDLWYSLPPTLGEWVSARYVQNVGPAPRWCGTSARYVGRTTTTLTKRVAPTTAAASAGSLASGARVDIICKLEGQNVAGNNRWYWMTDRRWVAARYVTNVGAAPGWCN